MPAFIVLAFIGLIFLEATRPETNVVTVHKTQDRLSLPCPVTEGAQ